MNLFKSQIQALTYIFIYCNYACIFAYVCIETYFVLGLIYL